MRRVYFLLAILFFALSSARAKTDRFTIVISLDGCRWDYPQWYDTPFFDEMASCGVEASLIPSFPSKTFPNHYTIATGLYPDHHGIIANTFRCRDTGKQFSLSNPETKFDPQFYGGEPIWLTAQRQGLRTAVFYWPGSDVKVDGEFPHHYYNYDAKPRLTFEQRIDGIIQQLQLPADKRPQLIMAYFEQPDANGHTFGPQARETQQATMQMDNLMRQLYERIQQQPVAGQVNFIVLSDHGMTLTTKEKQVPVRKYLKEEWLVAVEGDVPANIYAREGCADSILYALQGVSHISAWRRADVPAYLHYGTNCNTGDIIVMPELGWLFTDAELHDGGTHGFDPTYNDMHAMFRAVGPDFRHVRRGPFRNTNIYPLLCRLLGIHPRPNDGSLDEIHDILNF